MELEKTTKVVGMGLRATLSPTMTTFHIILVALGIVGNTIVIGVIGKSVLMVRGPGHNSDIIIVNLAVSNLMVSFMRNVLLVISDLGFKKTFMMKMDLDSGRDGKMGSEVDNFDTVTKDMEQDTTTQLVGMGLRTSMSPAQNAFYIILVALGIVGNAIVIGVIGKSVMMDRGPAHSSDIIIVNLAVSNLMVSLLRNMLLIISDLNFKLYTSKGWCQLLMGVWVWLRSVNVWSTFFLSAFHLHTLRRVAPTIGNLQGPWSTYRTLLLSLGIIWILNLLYSIPAHIFSTNGNENTTETLMLVSSTTRPLLGCVWNFPSNFSGLAYATTSMAIHEIFPIILMTITNMTSLYTLYNHGRSRSSVKDAPVIKRVPAERRAAKVILALVMLFIVSWGTSIVSVNYFNYNQGSSAEYLLVIARFANIIFIAMSPVVLAIGHRRLRSCMKSSVSD